VRCDATASTPPLHNLEDRPDSRGRHLEREWIADGARQTAIGGVVSEDLGWDVAAESYQGLGRHIAA
jgi:hypothetical protein